MVNIIINIWNHHLRKVYELFWFVILWKTFFVWKACGVSHQDDLPRKNVRNSLVVDCFISPPKNKVIFVEPKFYRKSRKPNRVTFESLSCCYTTCEWNVKSCYLFQSLFTNLSFHFIEQTNSISTNMLHCIHPKTTFTNRQHVLHRHHK